MISEPNLGNFVTNLFKFSLVLSSAEPIKRTKKMWSLEEKSKLWSKLLEYVQNTERKIIFLLKNSKMLAFKYLLNQFERCFSCIVIYKTISSLEGEMEIFLVITMYLDPHNLPTVQCDTRNIWSQAFHFEIK